jgi:hypothetical protein
MSETPRVSPGEAKTCSQCGGLKPHTEFHAHKRSKDRLRANCKSCVQAKQAARYRRDPSYQQNYLLQKNYGITLEGYDRLLEGQDNGCAICGKTPEENGQRLAVDHNHDTGKVRGLLCGQCNTGIGNLGDSPARLRLAIRYLEQRGHYGSD